MSDRDALWDHPYKVIDECSDEVVSSSATLELAEVKAELHIEKDMSSKVAIYKLVSVHKKVSRIVSEVEE